MAKHLETGLQGEQSAMAHLQGLGYRILHQNWRHRRWEVDLIAMDGDVLVFIEVKARHSNAFGMPHEFVDAHKQQNLIAAADAYLEQNNYIGEIRFDIVSVFSRTKEVQVIKDAFWSN